MRKQECKGIIQKDCDGVGQDRRDKEEEEEEEERKQDETTWEKRYIGR